MSLLCLRQVQIVLRVDLRERVGAELFAALEEEEVRKEQHLDKVTDRKHYVSHNDAVVSVFLQLVDLGYWNNGVWKGEEGTKDTHEEHKANWGKDQEIEGTKPEGFSFETLLLPIHKEEEAACEDIEYYTVQKDL